MINFIDSIEPTVKIVIVVSLFALMAFCTWCKDREQR